MATSNTPSASSAAAKQPKRIVVFGGNGFVGQGVVLEALLRGVNVVSVNRSGAPKGFQKPGNATGEVQWHQGDILDPNTYRDAIKHADGAVSCVGAFGSNEFMEKINGDANIAGINEAKAAGIPRFVYVSTVENNLPNWVLSGYFNGKRRAEQALFRVYPSPPMTGIVLRPGMISGTREVTLPFTANTTLSLPLWLLAKPLDAVTSWFAVNYARHHFPGMLAVLAPPITREALAKAAVSAALGELPSSIPTDTSILTVEHLKQFES